MAKAGKVSGKKNKAVDGSSRRSMKKLAGRAMDAAASSLVALAAGAHNMFDEMPTSFNDETYISTMGVGSNNSHWSQTNEVHLDDHEYEVDEDAHYYTKHISRRGEEEQEGNIKKGRPFTLPHCYDLLKDDEKWKPHEGVDEESNKRKRTIDLDDDEEEASSDDDKTSPTPNSVAYSKSKRPNRGKKDSKEKKKRKEMMS
ncbi:Alternative oxidase 1a, mitochondrial [Hordeum vulgare]|nr:Alternative oxidase 1a, mitochondrial [Hordeum vulgare]